MVTKEKARQINALVREKLGVQWDLLEPETLKYAILKPGFSVEHLPPFPPRLIQDGWKVGTSSWCCVCCNVVKQVPIAVNGLIESVNLVLFEIPADTLEQINSYVTPTLPRFFAQPVGRDSSFAIYDWNPIPLRSVEDFEKYLTGWSL